MKNNHIFGYRKEKQPYETHGTTFYIGYIKLTFKHIHGY